MGCGSRVLGAGIGFSPAFYYCSGKKLPLPDGKEICTLPFREAYGTETAMTFDIDLVRVILLEIEASKLWPDLFYIEVPGYSRQAVIYHLFLLAEEGLIVGRDISTLEERNFVVERMTWSGHDLCQGLQNPTIYAKLKATLAAAGQMTLTAVKDEAIAIGREMLRYSFQSLLPGMS